MVCALEDTQLQDMILDEIAQATRTDPTLRAVKELIQHGWPHQRQLVPEQARSYYNIKEDLTIDNEKLPMCHPSSYATGHASLSSRRTHGCGSHATISSPNRFLARHQLPNS